MTSKSTSGAAPSHAQEIGPIVPPPIVLGPDDKAAFPPPPVGFDRKRDGIARGHVETVTYPSTTVGVNRKMLVYTPPGYSKDAKYPTLYLLHGIGGDEREWIDNVAPDVILDNLYADGKLPPMIVVFPNGRAQPNDRPEGNIYSHAQAFENFEFDLLKDLVPFMEAHYPVETGREDRALAGYSMGGGQSLDFGLKHLDTFAWVGGFSPAPNTYAPEKLVPVPAKTSPALKLLWISCGDQDGLIFISQRVHAYLKENHVPHTWHVSHGAHTTPTWKEDLYWFSQQIFRSSPPTMPSSDRIAAPGVPGTPAAIHLEAEEGEMIDGTTVLTMGTGFSGKGYVGGFTAPNAAVRFHVTALAGIYEVRIRYRATAQKGYDLIVNGKKSSGMFAPSPRNAFASQAAGKIELNAGENEIALARGWGYYDIDALDLTPAPRPKPLLPVSAALSDGKATRKTRQLMAYLVGQYGRATLSGQQNVADSNFVRRTVGVVPAIQSLDLIDYSPTRAIHGGGKAATVEQMIGAYRGGQILSVMWHWNAPKDLVDTRENPWYRGFYTKATTFDLAKALADPKSEDYRLLLHDMDTIATQLKRLEDADIPVLWRPLHEAEGGWFWWGAKGPDAFKQLWRLMHDRFTNVHGLHNLIWVYTSGGKADWYPGDDVVDIVGADAYPSDPADPLSSLWEDLRHQYDGRKMLALSEYGGVPDVDRMARFGIRWLYFGSWGDKLGPLKPSTKELKRLYGEKSVVNRDRLPATPATPTQVQPTGAPIAPVKTFIDYFLPTPIVGKLVSDVWGAPGVFPRDPKNGLEDETMKKWCYWDGQIIKGPDGKYHMFASRWDQAKGHGGWGSSRAVHALSDTLIGTYIDKGLCWPENEGGKGHNVTALVLPDGRYAIVVSETRPGDVFISKSLDGPWEHLGQLTVAHGEFSSLGKMSNVSIMARPDEDFEIVARSGAIWISKDGILGPYTVQGPSVYPGLPGLPQHDLRNLEDPVVWFSGGLYHIVVNNWSDRKAYHLTSKDGIENWQYRGLAYDPTTDFVRYTDGTVNHWDKMERPGVLIENGHVTAMTLACLDVPKDQEKGDDTHGSKVIVLPFDGAGLDHDLKSSASAPVASAPLTKP